MIDEIALLRSTDTVPELSAAELAAIRTPLEAAIAEERTVAPLRTPAWRRSWLAGAAAAVAVAIALPVALTGGSSSPKHAMFHPPAVSGSTILARLADAAIAQPPTVPPGPGQYQYTASVEANQSCWEDTGGFCALVPEQRQIWVGPDGSGRMRETFGTPAFLTQSDEAAWKAAGSPSLGNSTSDLSFGPHNLALDAGDITDAPTDPVQLKAALEARKLEGGPPGPSEDFIQIGDLLREGDASPALRSALFQVASNIPGIVMLGNVTDHSGRSGVGIAWDGHGVRNELIFDSTTSALIGEQSVALIDNPKGHTGVTAGTVLDWTVYLASGIVDTTSTTPSGPAPVAPPITCVAVPDTINGPQNAPGGSASDSPTAGYFTHCTGNGP